MKIQIVIIVHPDFRKQWHTLAIIIDAIEKCWMRYQKHVAAVITVVESDVKSLWTHKQLLQSADVHVYVWDGFAHLKEIRGRLKVCVPSVIYIHGEGTIGFSRSMEAVEFFDAGDIFIAPCLSELQILKLCFESVRAIVCPYPLRNSCSSKLVVKQSSKKVVRIILVGRVSEQKNIHTALVALKIFIGKSTMHEIRVDIYGTPDQLGSPNMDLESQDYWKFLQNLVLSLDLTTVVRWHGYLKAYVLREMIQAAPHIFISASLHSDECFGMAAFDSLCNGNLAVLSAWGGHLDLYRNFKGQVELVPVRGSNKGPFISPVDFSEQLQKCFELFCQGRLDGRKRRIPRNYGFKAILGQLDKAIENRTFEKKRLLPSVWLKELHKQVGKLNVSANSPIPHVYEGYNDPLAQGVFECYGMLRPRPIEDPVELRKKHFLIMPWVEFDPKFGKIKVEDPHRGFAEAVFKCDSRVCYNVYSVIGMPMPVWPVSEDVLVWLLEHGYAYPL